MRTMGRLLFFLSSFFLFGVLSARQVGYVISSTESSKYNEKESVTDRVLEHPMIYAMDITSNVSNHFSKTLVASKVRNSENVAQETTFTVILPEKAFISEFVMEVGGKSYKAYVKEKEEAKQIYNQAVSRGQSAGHVAVSARDSNKFTVSVNIEPESKVIFYLTYEELLERKYNQYELIINIHPGQIVTDLNVKVYINETRPLKFVRTTSLRSGNEVSKNEDKLNPSSNIEIINSTTAIVQFSPDATEQKHFAKELGKKESDGLTGQFVVQYDVERDPHGGEVLLQDGYFVHFFAPKELEPLPKHVLFVLDSSSSMFGEKMDQLKDAMNSILNELRESNIISIVDFGSQIHVWNLENSQRVEVVYEYSENYTNPFPKLRKLELPVPVLVNNDTVAKARQITKDLSAMGGTNMIGGLDAALYLSKIVQERPTETKYQPIMIFLTDGQPNGAIGSTKEIIKIITRLNKENDHVPIFSLSFGAGADKKFLRELSLKNFGFSRHIYEASDASLQLQEFYKQISSPVLSNILFKYNDNVNEVTKTKFPIFFEGSEIVVTGRYNVSDSDFEISEPVQCWALNGRKTLKPVVERPVTSLERLWAYLTVKQTLEERELSKNKTALTNKALDIALKYSFVTDVTSLVVVKPNETNSMDTQEASRDYGFNGFSSKSASSSLGYGFSSKSASSSLGYGSLGYYRNPSAARPRLLGYYPSADGDVLPRASYGSPLAYRPIGFGSSYAISAHRISGSDYGMPGLSTSTITIPPFTNSNGSATIGPINRQIDISASTTTVKSKLMMDLLPWLASALNPNGTLTIAQNIYELGNNLVLSSQTECPLPPVNTTDNGACSLLSNCPEVYSYLTDFSVYQKYFCAINNVYAGVCCPKKKIVDPVPTN